MMGQEIPSQTDVSDAGPVPELSVIVVDSPEKLESYQGLWQNLADHAAEANIFYEPLFMLNALRAFPATGRLAFVFIVGAAFGLKQALFGFFPFISRRSFHRMPARTLQSWNFIHCFLGTPLVRAGYEKQTIARFVDWVQSRDGPNVVELRNFADGPFAQELRAALTARKLEHWVADSFERALFLPGEDFDAYVRIAMSGRHYKGIRRLERRLGETGTLRYDRLLADGDVDLWIKQFLELESMGWKGELNTALGSSEAGRALFTNVVRQMHSSGKLMMLRISLNERPIAMKCNFVCKKGSFAFKIAFDENLKHFSPGVLLEMENIKLLQSDCMQPWMDSCADADHIMINRLWIDRRTIMTLAFSNGRFLGNTVVKSVPKLRRTYQKIKALRRPPVAATPETNPEGQDE